MISYAIAVKYKDKKKTATQQGFNNLLFLCKPSYDWCTEQRSYAKASNDKEKDLEDICLEISKEMNIFTYLVPAFSVDRRMSKILRWNDVKKREAKWMTLSAHRQHQKRQKTWGKIDRYKQVCFQNTPTYWSTYISS